MTRTFAKVTPTWKQSALNCKKVRQLNIKHGESHTSVLSHTLITSNIMYRVNLKDPVTTVPLIVTVGVVVIIS